MQQPDPRSFQAVNIGLASAETGETRFSRDDHTLRPSVAQYRCNLTALSQQYNLYFVATNDSVDVYQPSFPFQELGRAPALRIPPSLAEPEADGYINGNRPHSINHLIVGDLGTEEILLLATDSGNIAAYHTKAIEEAIYRHPYKFSAVGRSDLVGLRAFFSHWVEESAWGLAVHTAGRMIAVSANKPYHYMSTDSSAKITVFAFALSAAATPPPPNDDVLQDGPGWQQREWYDWKPFRSAGRTPSRNRNFKITLGGDHGHVSNIPSVSFINNAEDADGSWLLSTDITGAMKLWRIWRGICHSTYDCGGPFPDPELANGGWLVAALDPTWFRPAYSMDQFCGHHRPRPAALYQGNPAESYDITNIVRLRTPGRSQSHPSLDQESDEEQDEEDTEEVNEEWSEEEEDEGEEEHKRKVVLGLTSLRLPSTEQPSLVSQSIDDVHSASAATASATTETAEGSSQAAIQTSHPVSFELINDDANEDATDDDVASDLEGAGSSSGSPGSPGSEHTQTTSVDMEPPTSLLSPPAESLANRVSPTGLKRPRRDISKNLQIPTVAVLQCSRCHVRLISMPKARSPHFFCANILRQDLPDHTERRIGHLMRLSMMQHIPELGVVIVASQLGRVAICTLTKNMSNGALGFRVDWILPTRRQEKLGQRPSYVLLGVAAAPIQGRQRSSHEGESGDSEERNWAEDRTIHGVKATFDHRVLVLDGSKQTYDVEETSSSDESSCVQTQASTRSRISTTSQAKPIRKRPRHIATSMSTTTRSSRTQQPSPPPTASSTSSHRPSEGRASFSSLSSQASTQSRPFPPLTSPEPWEAVEPSRRYRLMLTYLDSSVLTYELERGVERDDITRPDIYSLHSETPLSPSSGAGRSERSVAAQDGGSSSQSLTAGGEGPPTATQDAGGGGEAAIAVLADNMNEYELSSGEESDSASDVEMG